MVQSLHLPAPAVADVAVDAAVVGEVPLRQVRLGLLHLDRMEFVDKTDLRVALAPYRPRQVERR